MLTMTIDDFMIPVEKKWYRLYWAIMIGTNATIIAAYAITRAVPGLAKLAATFSLDGTALVLSAISLTYLLGLYWLVQRLGIPLATLFGTLFNSLVLLNGINQTDPAAAVVPYLIMWFATTLLNGMYGLPVLLGSLMVTSIYVLLASDFQLTDISLASWIMVFGTSVTFYAAYFFWRKHFSESQDQQVSLLSGQLSTTQKQSEILLQSITDGVIVIDTDRKITLINPAAAAMTEWPHNEATGVDVKLVAQLAKEDGEPLSDLESPFSLVLSNKEHVNQSLILKGRNNKSQIISLVISPIILPNTNMLFGAVAVMRDISQQRAAEQQRAEFISTASHEMRTPIAAIEGFLSLALNEKVSTIDPRARTYLDKAHEATQHLGELFQDLLTSSRAEDGRLATHPAVLELGTFLEQLTEELKLSAQKKGLLASFVVGAAEGTDSTSKDPGSSHVVKPLYYVHVDPNQIREVIANLFTNAVKYTEHGSISVGLTGDTDTVQIFVRDTGPGIAPDDAKHLFQKFYRIDSSATRTVGGTGLGLFICRKIIELYKGRIWVKSEVGRGSTFYVNLPRLTTQRAQELQTSGTAH